MQPPPWRRRRETPDWWTLSRSPARRSTSQCLQHALFVGVSRPGPACERQCQLKRLLINACAGPEQMARSMKSSTCVHDRLRFSEALGLGDNSHRNRSVVIHRLPQHRRGVRHLRDCRHWAQAPLDYDGPRPPSKDKRRTIMNDPAPKVRALYSVPEAMALLNLSRTQIYELIRTSRLVTVTQGRRRLVPADSITDYVQLLLEEYRAGGDGHAA